MTIFNLLFRQHPIGKVRFKIILLATIILSFATTAKANQSLGLTINQNQSKEIQLAQRRRPRRDQIDDRHNITRPSIDVNRWLNTMKGTRVRELFYTRGGLPGHVQQIQQEINSVRDAARQTTDATSYNDYSNALKVLRHSLISSAKDANFDFGKTGILFSPLASDLYLERRGGKLYVDGKPAE